MSEAKATEVTEAEAPEETPEPPPPPKDYSEVASAMNAVRGVKMSWTRPDTVIHLTDQPLEGSPSTPAWYFNHKADIYLNVARIMGEIPEPDDLRAPDVQSLLWGFVVHESLHSLFSDWSMEASRAVRQVAELFEELRIEKRGVDRGSVDDLRQSFAWLLRDLVADDKELNTSPYAVSHAWALTYGRHLAGIATSEEVESIDALARVELGDYTVDILREILSEAVVLEIPPYAGFNSEKRNRRIGQLRALAEEWLETLGIDPEETTPVLLYIEVGDDSGEGAGGDEGDEGEESEGNAGEGASPEESGDDDAETPIHSNLGEADSVANDDKTDDSPYRKIDAETSAMLRKAILETAQSSRKPLPPPTTEVVLDIASAAEWIKVFDKTNRYLSHTWSNDPPTPEQRAKARTLARTLEALSLPSITKTKIRSAAPPGRLRGRAMVRQAADRERHALTTAEPWERTKRRRTHTKPVIVGTMTDVSGSMSWAQEFVGEFAWVTATAGAHIGARTAAVTFGDGVDAVTRPDEIPQLVRTRSANGGKEQFNHAAAALDSVLHLTAPTPYAKVLFIVSDGELVISQEPYRAAEWIKRWTSAGCIVVWVACMSHHIDLYKSGERRPGALQFVDVPYSYRRGYDTDQLYRDLSKEVVSAASRVA